MVLGFRIYKALFGLLCSLMFVNNVLSQEGTSMIKAQFALGINNPSSNGFVGSFEGKPVNFPTVDLGVQYMFKPKLGAKLSYSFSRIKNATNTERFKLNYSRVNALFVVDANNVLSFLPPRMGVFLHLGPGYTMVKPLDNYTQNKVSFINLLLGAQLHYGLSDTLSVFTDISYTSGFGKDFSPVESGFGSFNGNVLSITFGASVSLSGCYFCNQ
ncbi:cell envelope biogenesis protein OmpA [Seonamhaeicola sp. ML3]|uniref:cell envelope biogenesis protein OmpA n=1 Tax=Seonamhaeicola sp. ML3 TaxID=2937786 RepID=UPI00200CCB84|nr:cell envelope biogenesis protein OmpA [Seonamhaeicola sp. ML3]